MSFWQIFLQFLGWFIIIWLHQRTLRRSELSRQKDALLTKTDDLFDYIKLELQKSHINLLELESCIAFKVTLLEFRLKQINELARIEILSLALIVRIRELDLDAMKTSVGAIIDELQSDITEQIESNYHKKLYNHSSVLSQLKYRVPEMAGAAFAVNAMIGLYMIVGFLFSKINY